MTAIADVMGYLCREYPHKAELSKARASKMIYLADWKKCLDVGEQVTDINWTYNHYGPYVSDIEAVARTDPRFHIERTTNVFGGLKEIISVDELAQFELPSEVDRAALDFVIQQTKVLVWNDFMKLIYSTYPVLTHEKGDRLDLPALAREYLARDNHERPAISQ